jgi:hypothetical protein
MKPIEHNTKMPTAATGFFATLCGLLHSNGSGAPKIVRGSGPSKAGLWGGRVSLCRSGRASHPLSRLKCGGPALLCAVVGLLAFSAAPALAAAPETPELRVESIAATTASFYGVLNPNAEGVAGTYEFFYKASKTGACQGGSHTPASPGISLGIQHEELPAEPISGLKANTEYAVCLLAETSPTEKTLSAPVTFTTAPEAPETLSPAKSVTATTAILEGVLNPKAEANAGWYFDYSTEATCTENPLSTPAEAEALVEKQTESSDVSELQPNKKYEFCLVAFNAGGAQATAGNKVSLMTEPAPPEASGESASPITTSAATLNAAVNPNNEQTTYFFEYSSSEAEVLAGKGTKVPATPPTALENYGFQGVSVPTGLLHADTTYYYRVVAENAQSVKEHKPAQGTVEHFISAPETPEDLKAEPITTSTAQLHGVLNPKATEAGDPETYEFVYRPSIAGCQGAGETTTLLEGAAGGVPEAVNAELTGLPPGETYAFCLRVRNEAGAEALSAPVIFTTLAIAPTIEAESEFATEVAASSATLGAKINPGGANTGYRVEYVSEAQFQAHGYVEASDAPTPEADAGPGQSIVPAAVHVQGLTPDTTYHYRFAASNAVQQGAQGEDRTFTTRPSGSEFSLPDSREWEMVSPPDKHGGSIQPITDEGGVIQASEDGSKLTYVTLDPITSEPAGNRGGFEPSQALAQRGQDGWSNQEITTPNNNVGGLRVGHSDTYRLFSPDLSLAVVEPPGDTPLASPVLPGEHQERDLWLRADATGNYVALATAANTQPGAQLGSSGVNRAYDYIELQGDSPDLSHIVFRDENALLEGFGGGIFEWAGGQLAYVGAGELGSENTASTDGKLVTHAVSDNGSRVIWNAGGVPEQLYLRNMERKETIQIGTGEFQTASSDGSKVFFTSDVPLTEGSSAGSDGGSAEEWNDLYVFEETEASREGGPLAGKLTDLSLDPNFDSATGEGEHAAVQGRVIGASEDGSYVYFVANGLLGDAAEHGATPGGGGRDQCIYRGHCNLYVEHDGAGGWEAPEFIATLSSEDSQDWPAGPLKRRTARVSPDGRWLAFMSDRSLTGYDNIDVSEREGSRGEGRKHADEEVYLFDAVTGRLSCASCNPSGQRPEGIFEIEVNEPGYQRLLVDEPENWPNRWLAANVPGWTANEIYNAFYQSRYLSNNGRLFFNSPDALVPADVNHKENVYEFEPEGVGGCSAVANAGEVFKPARAFAVELEGKKEQGEEGAGCVGLISSGTSSQESAFLDASATGGREGEGSEGGGDVFFMTTSQLAPQDVDQAYDIYDAHECSASSPCVSQAAAAVPPDCNNEASCKAAPETQPSIYGLPSSATFTGSSNFSPAAAPPPVKSKPKVLSRAQKLASALKVCRKKKGKQRTKCEKTARKQYGAKTAAKRASNDRRAGR